MAGKPKPAPIPTAKGFRLHFCIHGRQHKRFLIKNENVANILQSRINTLLVEYKNGLVELPPDKSLPDFIFESAVDRPTPKEERFTAITHLQELIDEYEKISAPPTKALSTWKTEKIHLKHLREFLQHQRYDDVLLSEISVRFFDLYKQFRYSQDIRTDTVKKELATFQMLFQMAVGHGYLEENVVKKVKRDKSQVPPERFRTHKEIEELLRNCDYTQKEIRDIKRFRYLTPDELERLIALAEGKWLHPILMTFQFTGMRRGEMTKLEWADIDLQRRFLLVRSRKQSQSKQEIRRRIYIADGLMDTLQAQREISGDQRWVFPGPEGKRLKVDTLGETFRRMVKGTEFEGLGFHCFRHSLASNLAAKGVDQRIIDRILGHQTEGMRQRYQHLFPEQMEEAFKSISLFKSNGEGE